jgi:hypothetical protein
MWNGIIDARACRACLAGLALAILSASLANAEYGPRTTIGANYQQWSSTQSQNGIDAVPCNNHHTCYVMFQPLPQQKELVVQHVSCVVWIGAGELTFGYLAARNGETFASRRTYLLPGHTSGGYWVVNNPAMHLLKSGERAFVRLESSQVISWFFECNISGQLQQP